MKRLFLIATLVLAQAMGLMATYVPPVVLSEAGEETFPLVEANKAAPIIVDADDHAGVIRVAKLLQDDIRKVTDVQPELCLFDLPQDEYVVIVGSLDKSAIVRQLIDDQKIKVDDIESRWETYLIEVVKSPLPGIKEALVIAGSDKRGTIYGMFDLSKQIGVSPWYWWADVPVKIKPEVFIQSGRYVQGEPAVKYRGIFLNDEAPALGGWSEETFGGFNHQFYEKVFELILRLKGNFLWPAMWWASFNSDDPLNPELADEYGIVMSTSHHEPMMRAHAEWKPWGGKDWNYETDAEQLQQFWREGIERMGARESVVTLAMRGDGDMAMSEGTNIALLEKIVHDQREILSDVTKKDITTIPQVWALYKEVQDYYDKGMRVPDDVTLLLCDDNWGNVRRLPRLTDPPRSGGYGMYYHFDFVGGPRSYKWLNTCPIQRVWEQLNLTYQYGVDRIWLVNVGDLKPMEFPISFFLDYAWNPARWPADRIDEYTQQWAEEQFGSTHAKEIANLLTGYTKFNGRRKPEMLEPATYSLDYYQEAETVVSDYNVLLLEAEAVAKQLPETSQDAFYQLVLHPIKVCANLNDLYVTVAKNRRAASQGRAITNQLAERAKTLFDADASETDYYHTRLASGKWNHMMAQTHIGYTYWNQPETNVMPEVKTIELPVEADMGISVQGSSDWWPDSQEKAELPVFDPFAKQARYIDVFNRGQAPFEYTVKVNPDWLKVAPAQGTIHQEQRLQVSIDWQKAPKKHIQIPIQITGAGRTLEVMAVVENQFKTEEVKGFVASNQVIAMEAGNFDRSVSSGPVAWQVIPDFGRTHSGVMPVPVTAKSQKAGGNSPHLEYDVHLFDAGAVDVHIYVAPTQNFNDTQGLRYGISFDDAPMQIVNIHANDSLPDWRYPQWWNESVSNNIREYITKHEIQKSGPHILKYWMIDPGIVLERIVIDFGGLEPSYLGPPESPRIIIKK